MVRVVSKINFGNIRIGDTVATFQLEIFAKGHYWVEKGWAYIK